MILRGTVRDALTQEPLPFANIVITGTTIGTVANNVGAFSLRIPVGQTACTISYLGYKAATIQLTGRDTTVVANLNPTSYMLQQVNVYARASSKEEAELSKIKMQNEHITQASGITEDLFRAVQALPGVSANNEASAKFNVRGGTSDENLVLVNGVRVYEPFHLKEEPLASVGIFNLDMVKKIDFIAGGFSAEYGDALSSVLNVDYRSGNKEKIDGKASLSLLEAGCLLEGPFMTESSWILGIRKSNLEYLMRWTNANPDVSMGFYDIHGQVDLHITPTNRLRLNVIRSGDDFAYNPSVKQSSYFDKTMVNGEAVSLTRNQNLFRDVDSHYFTDLVSIKSTNLISSHLMNETLLSYEGEYSDEEGRGSVQTNSIFRGKPLLFSTYFWQANVSDELYIRTLDAQSSLGYQPVTGVLIKAGLAYQHLTYTTDRLLTSPSAILKTNSVNFPDTSISYYPPDPEYNDTTNQNVHSYKTSGFIQANWELSDRLIVNAGARFDYFDMNKGTTWSPRLSLSYQAMPALIVRGACGIFYQSPTYNQLRNSEVASSHNTKSQRALHYILGAEQKCNEAITLKVEAYYKKYSDLIPVQRFGDGSLHYGNRQNNAEGYAQGIDLYVVLDFPRVYSWVSYSLLEARERLMGGDYYARYTDQRSTLSAVVLIQLGKSWNLSVKGFYGSGFAYTPYTTVYDRVLRIQRWIPMENEREHYPAYERIDFRVSKIFQLFGRPLTTFLDIMNLFGRRNVMSYSYTYSVDGYPTREANVLFPLIPSVGISYSF